jgi:predicted transcriptional regulator of viral defense system
MRPEGTTVERVIARMAHKSHGIVTRKQLQHAGLTPSEIKHRVGIGSLLRVHRGVYRVGHAAPSRNATYMAAVLACGEGAVLSGRAAAHLLGLLRGAPPPPEVTAPHACRITGIRARRSELHDSERWLVLGIPVTSVARTLVDLAGALQRASWPLHVTKPACGTGRHRRKWTQLSPGGHPCRARGSCAGCSMVMCASASAGSNAPFSP